MCSSPDLVARQPNNSAILVRFVASSRTPRLGVHNALHTVHAFRHQVIIIIHDENTAHIQLEGIVLLLGLEDVEGGTTWHKEQRPELQLALD